MPPIFVGLENYIRLAEDGFFRRAVANSFIFTFGSVIFKLLLGMLMALVLMTNVRWRAFWTGVLLIPWVAPTVVSALNFLWIFDGSLGVLNYLLVKVFRILPQGVGWLSEPGTAMASVIGVNVWRGFPFFGISFLAGMKAIPGELYEAAAVDGANAVQRFLHVTLPGIRNITIIVVLLSTIWTFNDFGIVYILTKGGPGGATMVMPVFTYETAFGAQRLGEAIAVALYLLPALAITIMVLARYMRKGRAR
jgi:multiple sugar transport system permease protein